MGKKCYVMKCKVKCIVFTIYMGMVSLRKSLCCKYFAVSSTKKEIQTMENV